MNFSKALSFSGCMGIIVPQSLLAIKNDGSDEMHSKLIAALQRKKEGYRNKFKQEMSFTRVLLKLGTVRTFMIDIRRVFNERDTDESGRIDICEMSAAMKDLQVNLSEDEINTLFKMADFYEDKQLTMKQFLVVLAMGYVLDAIPDLLESPEKAEAEAAARAAGRRMSNFYNKEKTVREALELFTYAYLLFDKDCKGVISRQEVMVVVAENGQRDTGSMSVLSQERWDEMDWDSNGDISFGEFVYAFTKWVDVDGEETLEDLEKKANNVDETDALREGGHARRKSSASVGRRTSDVAKEITRRLSSAILPGTAPTLKDGEDGGSGSGGGRTRVEGDGASASSANKSCLKEGGAKSSAVVPTEAELATSPSLSTTAKVRLDYPLRMAVVSL
ncbi:unnamed protein product [Pylaiella littoralis]